MNRESGDKVGVIIAAGGSSERMAGIDKLFAPLNGTPVLAKTITPFQRYPLVHYIVVSVNEKNVDAAGKLVSDYTLDKVTAVCIGGERRQDSVAAGLAALPACEWVIIHDGARPLLTETLIERGLEEAQETGSAIAAVPVTDTIKVADDSMLVQGTPPRNSLWSVQTPQVFRHTIITEAYRQMKYEVTDDATLVERAGYKVKLYMGDYRNIKITAPQDLALAELLEKNND